MGDNIFNVKAGVLDDAEWMDTHGKPHLEVYAERRMKWMPKIEGILQMNSKYEVIEGVIPEGLNDRRKT